MTAPLTATLPEGLVLDHGYTITLDAVDPATGAPVAGVLITDGAVTAHQTGALSDGSALAPVGPYMLVPGPNV